MMPKANTLFLAPVKLIVRFLVSVICAYLVYVRIGVIVPAMPDVNVLCVVNHLVVRQIRNVVVMVYIVHMVAPDPIVV